MIVEIPSVAVQYPIGRDLDNLKHIIQTYKEGFEKLEIAENVQLNLWCRGSSGSIIATAFALAIENDSRICHIKKPGESAHCLYPFYYSDGIDIIIDDLINTGSTIKYIYDYIVEIKRTPKILIVASGAEDLNLTFEHIISNYSE